MKQRFEILSKQQPKSACRDGIETKSRSMGSETGRLTNSTWRNQSRALEPRLRRTMESRFGHDFREVRIHTDTEADRSARTFDASAFSIGPDIFFRDGMYRPNSLSGMSLLAHELTHVVQQDRFGSQALRNVSRPDDSAEMEAESAGQEVCHGRSFTVRSSPSARISCDRWSMSESSAEKDPDDIDVSPWIFNPGGITEPGADGDYWANLDLHHGSEGRAQELDPYGDSPALSSELHRMDLDQVYQDWSAEADLGSAPGAGLSDVNLRTEESGDESDQFTDGFEPRDWTESLTDVDQFWGVNGRYPNAESKPQVDPDSKYEHFPMEAEALIHNTNVPNNGGLDGRPFFPDPSWLVSSLDSWI